MFTVFNIIIVAMVLLIAYWWANQGLLSAILHLLCVVVAGAIAFAVWEPLVVGLMLRGTMFDDYAWGTTLIAVFIICLVILRVTMDKLVPGNVDLPQAMNFGLALPVGAAAGIITIGIMLIGIGFVQSTSDIMGFKGMRRVAQAGARIQEENKLWAPVHQWTAELYSYMSVASLYPTFNNSPLRHFNPDVHFQAAGLIRDSAVQGKAKLSLRPSEAVIEEFSFDAADSRYMVRIRFNAGARDFGEQLTLSNSQIRLIGYANQFQKPTVVHPDFWTQYSGLHKFDDISHYITSEPGQSQTTVVIEFPSSAFSATPRFLQIRNTRFRLPAPVPTSVASGRGPSIATGPRTTLDQSGTDISGSVRLTNDINPIRVSTNMKPPRIEVNSDRYIVGGEGDFLASGGEQPSRQLMIMGIYEPAGTRIVQVNVSRESPANLFGDVREMAGATAKIMLVDSLGRTYQPVGFIHEKPDNRVMIKVNFQSYFGSIDQIPQLPTAGGQPLRLLFAVTEGATVAGLKLGEVTVGTCTLEVRPPV